MISTPGNEQTAEFPVLDLARGAAALWVLAAHVTTTGGQPVYLGLVLVCTLALAAAIFHLVEKAARELGKRLARKVKQPAEANAIWPAKA